MKAILSSILFVLLSIVANAQTDAQISQLYYQAEGYYEIGRIGDALEILEKNAKKFPADLKTNALKLSALCAMALDDNDKATKYTTELLHENPGYTPLDAPQRFKDLVADLKQNIGPSFSTASSSSESIEETPVPVTLITEEMIKACGAQTVQDALIAYVPGISVVEINGIMTFAYRGIYGASQEKMLIMLNGVRLNSYCSNLGLADYSNSIEKIKQIEVLRGPASSLYGDVALTGVVNIITKDGRDVDGIEVSAAAGNYGQAKGSVVFGKRFYDFDILAWSNIYRSDGQKAKAIDWQTLYAIDETEYNIVNPTDIIIGAFNHRPSFDYGTCIKYKEFSLMYICNSSKSVNPYTKMYDNIMEAYSYWKYNAIDGNMPGAAYTTRNVKAAYDKSFGKLGISMSLAYNREMMSKYFVAYESTINDTTYNYANYTEWEDDNYSASLRASYDYGTKNNGGSIVMGIDASLFRMLYTNSLNINDFTNKSVHESSPEYIIGSNEPKNNFLIQLKHRFGRLIINSGLRYDFKKHGHITANAENIYRYYDTTEAEAKIKIADVLNTRRKHKELSPRISLIYMLPRLNFKANYSKSFVDAPYLYRSTGSSILYFEQDLAPETAHSFQFTVAGKDFIKNLSTELNFFHNYYDDLITKKSSYYLNWDIAMTGLEATATYRYNQFSLSANAIIQRVIEYKAAKDMGTYENADHITFTHSEVYDNSIFNVPAFMANATFGYTFWNRMRVNANLYYTGKQYFCLQEKHEEVFLIDDEYVTKILDDEVEKIDPVFLVNPSINLTFGNLQIDIQVHNIFNHKYSLGGRCYRPIQQKGLWLMTGVSYKF